MIDNETFKKTVKIARDYVAKGWNQGCNARDEKGVQVEADSPHAVNFCVYGALFRANHDINGVWIGNFELDLMKQFKTIAFDKTKMMELSFWNDKAERTQEEVVELFDYVLEKAT